MLKARQQFSMHWPLESAHFFSASQNQPNQRESRLRTFDTNSSNRGKEVQYPCQVHCEGSIVDQTGHWMRERAQPEGRTTWGDANWIHELSKSVIKNSEATGSSLSKHGTTAIENNHTFFACPSTPFPSTPLSVYQFMQTQRPTFQK